MDGILRKNCCSFGFFQMRGGLPAQIFLSLFWPIKGVYFLQNANNLKFKMFLADQDSLISDIVCLSLGRSVEAN